MSLPDPRPLIVCLPGALLDPTQFAPQREALEGSIDVSAFDYAAKTVADGNAFTIEAAAHLLAERVRAEPRERRVALCGHSLGGMAALLAARSLGERLAGLMLLETSYGPATDGWARSLVPLVRAVIAITPWWAMRRAIVREHGCHDARTRTYLRTALPDEPPSRWREIVGAALRFDGREALPAISVPTLIVVGERHHWTHAQARTMVRCIPRAELQIVPRAGHMANLDAPAVVNGMMVELVR